MRSRYGEARQAVLEDCKVLESMDSAIDENRKKLDGNQKRLTKQIETMRSSCCCHVLIMLVLVGTLFVLTYFLIRIKGKNTPRV